VILSRFAKKVYLRKDLYAVYNSLIMDVVYCNKLEMQEIFDMKITNNDTLKLLKEKCIYIDDKSKDKLALNDLKKEYKKNVNIIDFGYFILTSNCNLACKYCFIENNKMNNGQVVNMSTLTAKIAIDKIDKYCKKHGLNNFLIIFYGGEPFINFEVMKFIVGYCKEKETRFNFSCVSNSTLLTDEMVDFIKESNIYLSISIDGYKELNDSNRIFKGDNSSVYDSVFKSVKLLKEKNIDFGLSITISDQIVSNKSRFLKWLDDVQPSYFAYNLMHYSEKTDEWKKYYPKASKLLLDSYDRYENCLKFHEDRVNRKLTSYIKKEFKYTDCGAAGNNQIVIKPNGDTCLCHGYFKTDEMITGNIVKDEIEKIIAHKSNEEWVNRVPIFNKKCARCDSLFVCGGGCGMQSEVLFNSIGKIDMPFCVHTKRTLKWILLKDYLLNLKSVSNE